MSLLLTRTKIIYGLSVKAEPDHDFNGTTGKSPPIDPAQVDPRNPPIRPLRTTSNMSRREISGTEDSSAFITDSMKNLMATGLRYAGDMTGITILDDTYFREFGSEQFLSRMLSTKSYISTSWSLAVKNQLAQEHPELKQFKEIGKGQTGTVWALTGSRLVIKLANEGRAEILFNDCQKHKKVEEAFYYTSVTLRRHINIPTFGEWVHPSNELFWDQHIPLFPEGCKREFAFFSARIFPLPEPIRIGIVDAFAPDNIKADRAAFLDESTNKDCLVRIYLGRRAKRTGPFKLRNFDMMVHEMEYLRLDTNLYAKTMAETLAVMHWKAGLDANHVEFVLGSSPQVKMLSATAEDYENATMNDAAFFGQGSAFLGQEYDFRHRSIGIWLLDFDQCQKFEMTAQGIKQLEKGFYFNDPYYPRPASKNAKDVALWALFKQRYLEVSGLLIQSTMPQAFIAAVEAEGARRANTGSMFHF